jgi:surfactin synthase thioesterase subunit
LFVLVAIVLLCVFYFACFTLRVLMLRAKDTLEPDVAPIVNGFLNADVIAFLNEKPYALLGNSLGAWLAYELILEIAKRDHIQPPVYFFPCASSPSHKRYVSR